MIFGENFWRKILSQKSSRKIFQEKSMKKNFLEKKFSESDKNSGEIKVYCSLLWGIIAHISQMLMADIP